MDHLPLNWERQSRLASHVVIALCVQAHLQVFLQSSLSSMRSLTSILLQICPSWVIWKQLRSPVRQGMNQMQALCVALTRLKVVSSSNLILNASFHHAQHHPLFYLSCRSTLANATLPWIALT